MSDKNKPVNEDVLSQQQEDEIRESKTNLLIFLDYANKIQEILEYYNGEDQKQELNFVVEQICVYDEPRITFAIAERYKDRLPQELVTKLYKSVAENKQVQAMRKQKEQTKESGNQEWE